MLVTHVITRLIVGGAQENTVSTVLGMQDKPGISTDLISGPSEGIEGSLEQEFSSLPGKLKMIPSLVRPVKPWLDLKAFFELTRIFMQTAPVIVHTHSGKAGILGRLAAKRAKVPLIIHTIHGPSFGPWQGALSNAAFMTAERMAGKVTHHFISVAKAMTQQYLNAGIGAPDLYTRIFSGFRLEPFLTSKNDPEVRAKFGLCPEDIVVGKIARFVELKGHEDLFHIAPELIRRNPKLKFLLIGGGPLEPMFKRRATELGVQKHFVFTGLVAPSRIPELAGIMDFLIHLSVREGLPRALPQALASGKPVIAYNCDGAGEVCLENKTGFLVAPGDFGRLIEAVETLASSPEMRRTFGETGRNYARENFAVETMVHSIYNLYLEQLKSRGFTAGP